MNKKQEEKYLSVCLNEVDSQIYNTTKQLNNLEQEKKEFSEHFSENYYFMDDEEALGEGEFLGDFNKKINDYEKALNKLYRQASSPYFASVKFKDDEEEQKYYIGPFNLLKKGETLPLVCDWRAPVSSLFYDYESGDASYLAPDGRISGKILEKTQYKIKDGKLEMAVNSSLAIQDEILKQALSENSTAKMKTIVSTIQKEQNQIIRNEVDNVLLVQGVAGSGKTSIALHRVAYLLYKYKNTLKSDDILIISPNTLFSEYISGVLPELGEEDIMQVPILTLAQTELRGIVDGIQSREEMLEEVIKNHDALNQNAYKNTFEFYESLKTYLQNYFSIAFEPTDLHFGKLCIKAEEMSKLFNVVYKQKSPAVRIDWIVDYIMDQMNLDGSNIEVAERIKKNIYPFFKVGNIFDIYSGFLSSIGMEFSLTQNNKIKYEDFPAIWFIKNHLLGCVKEKSIKHLIVDEMQDYSPIIYDILNQKFECKKTILGDVNQCIDKVMSEKDVKQLSNMLGANLLVLNKAYRSTYEITEFAEKIKNISCDKVLRHGEKPKILKTTSQEDFIIKVKKELQKDEDYSYTAILTKDAQSAKELYYKLNDVENLSLLVESGQRLEKIIIMPIALAKGLEFDRVIIPDYKNYNSKNYIDKNLLYVAATRALHKLILFK